MRARDGHATASSRTTCSLARCSSRNPSRPAKYSSTAAPAARPLVVVVEHDPPAGHQQRRDPRQAGHRRLVPVAVEVGERDRLVELDRVLEQALDQLDVVLARPGRRGGRTSPSPRGRGRRGSRSRSRRRRRWRRRRRSSRSAGGRPRRRARPAAGSSRRRRRPSSAARAPSPRPSRSPSRRARCRPRRSGPARPRARASSTTAASSRRWSAFRYVRCSARACAIACSTWRGQCRGRAARGRAELRPRRGAACAWWRAAPPRARRRPAREPAP